MSLTFTNLGRLQLTLPAVLAAEEAGLDGVWSAGRVGFHDAVVPSALYLCATPHLEVGRVALSIASRHTGITAMELLSLSEIGRDHVQDARHDPITRSARMPSQCSSESGEIDRPESNRGSAVAAADACGGHELQRVGVARHAVQTQPA